jgi:hypothetical protein
MHFAKLLFLETRKDWGMWRRLKFEAFKCVHIPIKNLSRILLIYMTLWKRDIPYCG